MLKLKVDFCCVRSSSLGGVRGYMSWTTVFFPYLVSSNTPAYWICFMDHSLLDDVVLTSVLCSNAGKASQLYSHNLSGLFEQARQLQKLPVAIPTHKLPDKIIPR